MNRLMALLFMVAVLAIGNTAAAGPFGVNMGDPLKPEPDLGWDTDGFGTERRKYEGSLPFDGIWIFGTREGGVCGLTAFDVESTESEFDKIKNLLVRKYGPAEIHNPDSKTNPFWLLVGNPDNIGMINLIGMTHGNAIGAMLLTYHFENDEECNYPKTSTL